jgi:hypothetical protein
MLAGLMSSALVFLGTLPHFTIGRDERSTSGAYHGFVVIQCLRITESETSTSGTTDLSSQIGASFTAFVAIQDLVDRHGLLNLVGS